MDELKRSLEEAIKELQDIPAATPATSLPKTAPLLPNKKRSFLEQALAAGPIVPAAPDLASKEHLASEQNFAKEQGLSSRRAPVAERMAAAPAANSIEAALAMAPSVSPHYVPPPAPAPAPTTHEVVPAIETLAPPAPVPTTHEVAPAIETLPPPPSAPRMERPVTRVVTRPVTRAVEKPLVQQARPVEQERETVVVARVPAARQAPEIPVARVKTVPVPAQNVEDLVRETDHEGELVEQDKKQRDKIWRWATIGISCAGGLASGWLGSIFSDQPNGLLQSGMEVVTSKVAEQVGSKLPIDVKMIGTAKAGKLVTPGEQMTGKTDRAVPIDENHCTVLERDRSTGLTLAKPCKLIETAEFNSTLDKSDLLVKPH